MKKMIRFKILDIDDSDELLKIEIHLNNGLFASTLEIYDYIESIQKFGIELTEFPNSKSDEVIYEIGEKGEKWAFYLLLKACYKSDNNSFVIKTKTSNNGFNDSFAQSEFEIIFEPASINRFGESLRNWNPKDKKIIEWNEE
jgi:hypothetical protein